MAEAFFNAAPPAGWRARSAGTEPNLGVAPEAISVLAELGIDITAQRPKGLTQALGPDVELVIGLCAEEACPVIPGVRSLHWPLPDPRRGDLDGIRRIRDDLRERIARLRSQLEGEAQTAV